MGITAPHQPASDSARCADGKAWLRRASGLLLLAGSVAAAYPGEGDYPMTQPVAVNGFSRLPAQAQVRLDPLNGTIKMLKGSDLSAFLQNDGEFRRRVASGQWGAASVYFLKALGSSVRLDHVETELAVASVASDDLGFRHVKLRQRYANLPVWEAEIIVHWNARNGVYLVTGDYLPTPSGLSLPPTLDPAAALKQAEAAVSASCSSCSAELGVWRGTEPRLAYRVIIPQGIAQVWQINVDAHSGAVLDKALQPR